MQSRHLNEIQETFLRSVKGEDDDVLSSISPISTLNENECVDIYRKAYVARLTEALGETFEATWWVLGDEDFFKLCGAYIKHNPSFTFDLSDYGQDFPRFLATQIQAEEIPFLVDLAKFEWQFKEIFHKGNVQNNLTQLSNVNENTILKISPSAIVMESRYSIYEIWKLRTQPIEKLSSIDLQKSEILLLHKLASQVYVRRLERYEFEVVETLTHGHALGDVLLALEKKGFTTTQIQKAFALITSLGALCLGSPSETPP